MDGIEDTAAMISTATSIPPFLNKTYDMVDDPSTDYLVSWTAANNSFVVWNDAEFAKDILPRYFKHSNFSSFVRQLNTYGFKKVHPDRWEFANEGFLRGQKHLLKTVNRRKQTNVQSHQQSAAVQAPRVQSSQVAACVQMGNLGLGEEVERLKRDKNTLMQELISLRQEQQATDNQLQNVGQRVQGMEQRQQQMMSFLAKAMHSPGFLSQLVQHQSESNRRITGSNKKRRLPMQEEDNLVAKLNGKNLDGQIVKYQPSMNEAAKAMLQQIMKMNISPRREPSMSNPDAFLIDNVPSYSVLDNRNCRRNLGVSLSEVSPTSNRTAEPGFPVTCQSIATAQVQPSPYVATECVTATQISEDDFYNLQEDTVLPELTAMQGIVPPSTAEIPNANFMASEMVNTEYMDVSVLDRAMPTETETFSPEINPDADVSEDGEPNLPGINDVFWDKFFDTDDNDVSSVVGVTKDQEMQPGKGNGWDKIQYISPIAQQTGLEGMIG
ncbi:heat stress transcription factor A-1b-like [Argentina anserina]|uniref:heat stress transcription factor A-1b-like n=1 Tax=Argentina anserina TaxID=57926 RepID=UPI0021762910|nr:heat stress transcription factor A-1b-like [Potentilla anserina]XP_050367792.1 heat stress transcription factor A-1b-like [Potentilla anserina]